MLNGDTFDLYKYSYNEIAETNTKIIEYFTQKGFILIRGNHDVWVKHTLDHYQITNSMGKTIHIEHGHKADFLNGTRLGRFLA